MMDIITQLSALDVHAKSLFQESPILSSEGLDELEAVEGHSLFLHYLTNLQAAITQNKETYPQPPVIQQPIISQLKEGLIQGFDGKQLPLGGNQYPLASLSSYLAQNRLPESFAFTEMPFIAVGGKSPAAQFQDNIVDIRLNPPSQQGLSQGDHDTSHLLLPAQSSMSVAGGKLPVTQFQNNIIDLQLSPPRFEQALGNRVLWMVGQNLQAAELRINPPHLGPLEVHISLEGQHTKVSFITQHAEVREMMESSMPRLRDSLAEAGLNSVNVDVSQQDLSQRRHDASNFLLPAHRNLESSAEPKQGERQDESEQWLKQGSGLVDYFA